MKAKQQILAGGSEDRKLSDWSCCELTVQSFAEGLINRKLRVFLGISFGKMVHHKKLKMDAAITEYYLCLQAPYLIRKNLNIFNTL
ncbi:MAG TPA: hypothetical protein VF884_02420 [Nitrososphaeraceae archaeon]